MATRREFLTGALLAATVGLSLTNNFLIRGILSPDPIQMSDAHKLAYFTSKTGTSLISNGTYFHQLKVRSDDQREFFVSVQNHSPIESLGPEDVIVIDEYRQNTLIGRVMDVSLDNNPEYFFGSLGSEQIFSDLTKKLANAKYQFVQPEESIINYQI